MTEQALTSGEPAVEHLFQEWFASGADIPSERAADLVVYLASGQADALSGRYVSVNDDVPEMVSRANEIDEDDLCVMRLRELPRR